MDRTGVLLGVEERLAAGCSVSLAVSTAASTRGR
jgi:hypothetical protein